MCMSKMAIKHVAFSVFLTILSTAVVHVDTIPSCRLCHPGHHMVRRCKEGKPSTTRCARCPANSYTDIPNLEKGCYPHRKCNTTNEIVVFPGNSTHDVRCRPCDGNNHPCQRSQGCPPGEGVKMTGGCGLCLYGTFNNESSSTLPCRPWTRCHDLGLVTIRRGTSTMDAICGDGGSDLSVDKAIHTSEQSNKIEERNLLIINTFITGVMFLIILCSVVFVASQKACRQKTYEEGNEALPIQCEDTHPKELEAACSFNSASHLLPDQSTSDTLPSSSTTLATHDEQEANEWSPMIAPSLYVQEALPEKQSACYGFPVADGFHTLPKATTSANTTSDRRHDLPFRPMSCSTDTIPSTLASSHETSASSLEYQQKVNSALSLSYAKVLSASATEELKANLGQQWTELARSLKLTEHQINQILNENRSDLQAQIYSMLRCWQEGKTGEATIPELYGALKECNRLDILQKLQALEKHDKQMTSV
ncbi:uncharacterized protein LOC144907023 [Branchiostoma floridae x Branchiostoma belcheri]